MFKCYLYEGLKDILTLNKFIANDPRVLEQYNQYIYVYIKEMTTSETLIKQKKMKNGGLNGQRQI